ncbi:immunoglobulin-like domain-containing protein [Aeromonas sp. RU39B]|uniref:immunoglobulin-like domain-containing protein n=1 Tax=Aeromonas sp. RU39B TaxID=1907416 RepID=UPI002115ED19|nr:immunoglobulin-like domain-containing protein [Aeromonas sp. RU39B]
MPMVDATLTLSAESSVAEGGVIHFIATVDNPVWGSDLQVLLSNGLTLVIPVGQTTGTITSAAPTDDVYLDASHQLTTITGTQGGAFARLGLPSHGIETEIPDTIDPTHVSLSATPSVNEGDRITYSATLDHAAQGPVTVTLDNGQTITIADGQQTGSVSVTAGNDVYVGQPSVSAHITTATGGNFEHLVVNSAPAETRIDDSIDTTTVSLSATPSVNEGDRITYTATLNHAAQGPVTVTLDNGQTITIADGLQTGSVSVTAGNDVYVGQPSVSAHITSATGGNFEHLVVNSAPAETRIGDRIDTTQLTLKATLAVAEGGSVTYTASLTEVARTDMQVTLSNGHSLTIAAGSSSGSVSVPVPDDVYHNPHLLSVTLTDAQGGDFEALHLDRTPAVSQVVETLDPTRVSLNTMTPSVAEGHEAIITASLTHEAHSPVSVLLSNGMTLTIPTGASSVNMPLLAGGEDVYLDAGTLSLTIAQASGGNFEHLVVDPQPVTVQVSDTIDTTTVSLSATPSVNEGDRITYSATLDHAAQGPVTVTLDNGQTITIADGQQTGSVSVTAGNDVYVGQPSVSAHITSATGGNFEHLVVNSAPAETRIGDRIDTTQLTLKAALAVAEGGSVTYTASLTHVARTDVQVTLSNGHSLTIAAGSSSGSVSVPVPDDVYHNPHLLSVAVTDARGGDFEELQVSSAPAVSQVVETIDPTRVSLSTTTPTVAEGHEAIITASLTHEAHSPVSVLLSNGMTLIIPAGSSSVNIPLLAGGEDVYLDAGTLSLTIAQASGGNFEHLVVDPQPVTVQVSDTIDTTTVSLSATPSVNEGDSITYSATLDHAAQGPVTVTLDNGQTITIADGQQTGSVSVTAGNDVYVGQPSVSAHITTATGGNFEHLVVNSAPAETRIGDKVDITTATLTADKGALTEAGGTIVYTAMLGNPGRGETTVHTVLGDITIASGQTSGTLTHVVAAGEDVYVDPGVVSNAITRVTGGDFEQVKADTTPVTTAITDTTDPTTVALTADKSTLTEAGGAIVYTATLSHESHGVTMVHTQLGDITIADGDRSGTLTHTVPTGEDVYLDPSSVSNAITGAEGGHFEQLVPDTTPVTTTITDTIDTTTIRLTAPSSVVEGRTITYTAQVDHPVTGSDLVLTLSNGQQLTIPVGASTGSLDVATRPADVLAQGDREVELSISGTQGGNYERLDSSAHVSTTVTDSALPVQVTLTGSAGVKEGGVVTWIAQVDHAPATPLLLTLDNGSEITIKAGELTGSVEVKVHPDTVYVDAGTVNAAITAYTGGGYSHLELPSGSSTVSVGDTIDTTTVSLSATPSVNEGDSITYTATLDHAAQGPVTVTLDNGQTITIADGQQTGSVSVTAGNDVYVGQPSVSAHITAATGGNFEHLVVNSTPAETRIGDKVDITTATLTADKSTLTEAGGSIVYTATLGHPGRGETTVHTVLGDITIASGQTSGTLTHVVADGEDVYVDPGVVSNAITRVTGGDFEQVKADSTPVNTTITDTIDTTSVTLTGTSGVKEGGDITWTVTLGAPAHGEVTVQLDNGKTVVIADGQTSGQVITMAPDDLLSGGSHVTASVVSAMGGSFEKLAIGATATVSVVDNASPVYARLVNVSGTVTEGDTLQHRVELIDSNGHLVQVPTGGAVTVALTYGPQTTSPSDFSAALMTTVTIPAGQSSAVIENQSVVDSLYEGREGYTLTISGVTDTAHSFESLGVASGTGAAVDGVITDADSAPVLSVSSAQVIEGGDLMFTVSRNGDAQAAQSVKFATLDGSANSSDYTAASGSLTFNPGEMSKTVTVHTTADTLFEGNENLYLTLSQPNFGSVAQGKAMGTIIDDDSAPRVASISSPSVTEGQSLVFDVTLTNAASSLQRLAFSLGGGSAGIEDYGKPVFSNGVVLDHGHLEVPAGMTHFSVTLPTTDDLLTEPTETVVLTIGGVTGAGSILDNDAAPTYTLPSSLAADEDTPKAVRGIQVADRDSTHLSTTLSVLHGTLLVTAGHATVHGNHGQSLTISGTAADINAALATLIYTGKPDYHGADTLQVETSDGDHYATGSIPITVASVADIVADSLHVDEDASLSFNPLTGLGGASADNFEDSARQVTGHTNPSHGTLTIGKDGEAHYTPVTNYYGTDSFTYTVSAGGSTETATVTIDVKPINDAPTSPEIVQVSGNEDTTLLLTWDNFKISDVDGGKSPGIKIGSLPADGKLEFTVDGQHWKAVTVGQVITKDMMDAGHFHFLPDANEAGDDGYHQSGVGNMKDDYAQFNFTPVDGEPINGEGKLAHMHIDIRPEVDAPRLAVHVSGVTHEHGRTIIEMHQSHGLQGITIADGQVDFGQNAKVWHLSDIQGQGGNVHGTSDKSDVFVLTDASGAIRPEMAGAVHSLDGAGDKIDSPQDYIYLAGPQSRYDISYSANHVNTAGGGMDNLFITDTRTHQTVSVGNNIENIIFGDTQGLIGGHGLISASGATASTRVEPGVDHYTLQLTAALVDTDGSEQISDITFNGLPDGSTLNLGHHGTVAGSWVITHQELAQGHLELTVKEGQSIDGINVAVTSTEVDGEHATSTLALARGAHVSVSHDAVHEVPVESVVLQAAHHVDAAPAPDHPLQLGDLISGQHEQGLFAEYSGQSHEQVPPAVNPVDAKWHIMEPTPNEVGILANAHDVGHQLDVSTHPTSHAGADKGLVLGVHDLLDDHHQGSVSSLLGGDHHEPVASAKPLTSSAPLAHGMDLPGAADLLNQVVHELVNHHLTVSHP